MPPELRNLSWQQWLHLATRPGLRGQDTAAVLTHARGCDGCRRELGEIAAGRAPVTATALMPEAAA
jgi:hypothetical protein